MNKFFNEFYKIILGIMIFLWGIITFSSCFHVYGRSYNPAIIIVGSIIIFTIIYNFYKAVGKTNTKNHDKIAFGMFAIVFSMMLLWGLNTQIVPAYDLTHIIAKSDSMLLNNHIFGSDLYFSIYPTQIPITILVYAIKAVGSLLGFANPSEFVIIYNAFMTSLMLLFIYKIGKKLTDSKTALCMMLLASMYPDFYLYVSYYYTDIVALPFAIIGFYFLLQSEEKKSRLYLILASILFGIGFKLRVTVLILLIAYILCMFRKYSIKTIGKRTLIVIIGILISVVSYNKIVYPMFSVELNPNVKVPITHWIMMGVNKDTNGGYTDADINFSINTSNKNTEIMKVIKKRVTKLDITFFYNKIRKVWSEGDHDIQRKYALTSHMNGLRLVTRGELSGIERNYAQILKFSIYLLFLMTIVIEFKNVQFKKSKNAPLIICLFGAIIFYLIWEALSRYSFSFLPMTILGISLGVKTLVNFIDKEKIRQYNFIKIKKIIGVLLISVIAIASIVATIHYSLHPSNFDLDRNAQIYSTRTYTPLYNKMVKQVFRVHDNFNYIQLKFMTDQLTNPLYYRYELYDNSDALIDEGDYLFLPDSEKIVRKIKIKLQEVEVSKESEYYLLFYSQAATENNYVSINSYELKQKLRNSSSYSPEFYGSDFDINPNAETYFDNQLSKGNIYFRAYEKKKENILKNRYFIIIAFFVILIVMYNIFICLLKRRND